MSLSVRTPCQYRDSLLSAATTTVSVLTSVAAVLVPTRDRRYAALQAVPLVARVGDACAPELVSVVAFLSSLA